MIGRNGPKQAILQATVKFPLFPSNLAGSETEGGLYPGEMGKLFHITQYNNFLVEADPPLAASRAIHPTEAFGCYCSFWICTLGNREHNPPFPKALLNFEIDFGAETTHTCHQAAKTWDLAPG